MSKVLEKKQCVMGGWGQPPWDLLCEDPESQARCNGKLSGTKEVSSLVCWRVRKKRGVARASWRVSWGQESQAGARSWES